MITLKSILVLDTEPVMDKSLYIKKNKDYYSTSEGEIYITYNRPEYNKIFFREFFAKTINNTDKVLDETESTTINTLKDFESYIMNHNIDYIVGYNIAIDIYWILLMVWNRDKKDTEFIRKLLTIDLLDLQPCSRKYHRNNYYLKLETFYNNLCYDESDFKHAFVSHKAKSDCLLTEKIYNRLYNDYVEMNLSQFKLIQ